MIESNVQLIRAPCSQLRVDYTCTMSDNKVNSKGLSKGSFVNMHVCENIWLGVEPFKNYSEATKFETSDLENEGQGHL